MTSPAQPESSVEAAPDHLIPRVVRQPTDSRKYPHTPLLVQPRPDRRASRALPLLERPLPTTDPDSAEAARIWDTIDHFNRHARAISPAELAAALDQARSLFGPIDPRIIGVYAAADHRATQLQRQLQRLIQATYGWLAASLFFFGLADLQAIAITGFVICLTMVAVRIWLGRRLENAYLDCRALAEGIRVLGFWRRAGMTSNVTDRYLTHHLAAVDWIRTAIAQLERAAEPPPPATPDDIHHVNDNWVRAQCAYFAGKLSPTNRRARFWAAAAPIAVVASVAIAVLYTVWLFSGMTDRTSNLFQAILAWIGGLAVVTEGYDEKRGFTKLLTQYQLAHGLFDRAAKEFDAGTEPTAIFLQLGEEALRENGEWLAYFRSHPLTLKL
jgi:hypothetical protein